MGYNHYEKEELERILEHDFLLNPHAFSPGRTNDDMVDSMLICFILEREWTELFSKWTDNYQVSVGDYEYINHTDFPIDRVSVGNSYQCPLASLEIERILGHYNRVKKWIQDREDRSEYRREHGWDKDKYEFVPGNLDLMVYAINY